MTTIKIVSKETHQEIDYSHVNKVVLQQSSVVVIHVNQTDVAEIVRQGSHVIVILKSGERIVLEKFFNYTDDLENSLVLNDQNGQLHWLNFKDTQGSTLDQIQFHTIEHIDTLLYSKSSVLTWGNLGLATLAGGALALGAGGGDSNGGEAPKTIPAKPRAIDGIIDNHGSIQGKILAGSSTDDNTPSISIGTLPAGTTAKLYVGGTLVESHYDPSTGFITPVTPLIDGVYQLAYSLSNELGEGAATDPITIIIDTIAPTKPNIITNYIDDIGSAKGNFLVQKPTDDTTPSFEIGVIPSGHTANLYVNGSKVNATYNATTGTLTPTVALTNGIYQISYTITDAAGNESPRSDIISLTIDTIAPDQPLAPTGFIDDAGLKQGSLTFINPTDDTTPSLKIASLPTWFTAKLYVNNQLVDSVYDSVTGTLTPLTALTEGVYNLTYSIVDAAGNESPRSPAVTLSIDTTAPAQPAAPTGFYDNHGVQIGHLTSGQTTDDTTPALTIGVLPVGLSPVLYVDGERVESSYDPDTGYITPLEPLGDGLHQVYYTVADLAGNESTPSTTLTITVSTGAPAKPVTPTNFVDNQGPEQGTFSINKPTDDTTPSIVIGTLLAGEEASLYINNQKVASIYDGIAGTLTPLVALSQGSYSIRYTITDLSGTESVKSTAITIIVDTTAPEKPATPYGFIDNVGPKQGAYSIIKATDDSTPSLIIVPIGLTEKANLYINGTKVESTFDRATGTLSPLQAVAEGNVSFQYSVSDAAGNESPLSDAITIVIDTTPPLKPYDPLGVIDNEGSERGTFGNNHTMDDKTPSLLIGEIDDDQTATLYINGVKVEAIHDRVNMTLTPIQTLNDGTYVLTYTISDHVGNESIQSESMTVIINTSPPPATTSAMISEDLDLNVQSISSESISELGALQVVGTAQDDVFDFQGSTQHTLIYQLLNGVNETGGNGLDTVIGFKLANSGDIHKADKIDLKDLLIGYIPDADGAAHYSNGVATLDVGETIVNYLKVVYDGTNTMIEIDRDGLENGLNYSPLLTLTNVQTDLVHLLANHQLVIA